MLTERNCASTINVEMAVENKENPAANTEDINSSHSEGKIIHQQLYIHSLH